MTRTPKKSDSIEIRLAHDTKSAFMAQCRADGRTASAALRGFVEAQIARGTPMPEIHRPRRFAWLAKATVTIGAVALVAPATVSAAPDFEPSFAAFDRNGDRVLTRDELGPTPSLLCAADPPVLAIPLHQTGWAVASSLRPFALSTADLRFATADADKDGRISRGEYAANQLRILRAGFDALDSDHDGSLRIREYIAVYAIDFRGSEPQIASFQELDRDGDGKVAWNEFLA